MIQLRANGLIADAIDVEQRRREFHSIGWTRFPALLEPRLVRCVQEGLDQNPWDDYFKAGFDSNEILTPSPPLRLLQFVTNWPAFLALIGEITAAGPLTWFGGRVYRMRPGVGHHDDWHDDNIDGRLSAMSLNLSPRPYQGGLLQIRRRGTDSPHVEVANTVAGDAILFQVSDALVHRVTDIQGTEPKVAFAGWFNATLPSLMDRLRANPSPAEAHSIS